MVIPEAPYIFYSPQIGFPFVFSSMQIALLRLNHGTCVLCVIIPLYMGCSNPCVYFCVVIPVCSPVFPFGGVSLCSRSAVPHRLSGRGRHPVLLLRPHGDLLPAAEERAHPPRLPGTLGIPQRTLSIILKSRGQGVCSTPDERVWVRSPDVCSDAGDCKPL